MIDINEMFPNSDQIIVFEMTDHCNSVFEQLRGTFYDACETSPLDPKYLLEDEINRYEKYKDKTSRPQYYYEGICLDQLFEIGWISYTGGRHSVPNDGYKRCQDVVMQIFEKFKDTDPPTNFFEELTDHSIHTYYFGMGYSKYYYWLRDTQKNNLESEKGNKGISISQQTEQLEQETDKSMFELFNRIVRGNLRPHLINDTNLSEIKSLLHCTLYIDKEKNTLKSDNEYINLIFKEEYSPFEIVINKENPSKSKITILKDENLEELINIDFPPPPDEKAGIYLTLLEIEIEVIKYKIDTFLNNTNDINSIQLFALKNIQNLKGLSEHLSLYIKKLGGEHGNLFSTDANHFILYIIKYYIMEIIQYLQRRFKPFIKTEIESVNKLKKDLFTEFHPRIPMFTIFSLLPKEQEYEDFKKEFIENMKGKSIGESLFNHYKSKNIILNTENQIINYVNVIHFWDQLLITNKLKVLIIDNYINEPEIEKILIPLLEKEIEFLQKESIINKPAKTEPESDNIIDLPSILLKIKFSKNDINKNAIERILSDLNERGILRDSNDRDFATIAFIIFQTGWVNNISTFSEWQKLFSESCKREPTSYKPNKLKDNIETIKKKSIYFNDIEK